MGKKRTHEEFIKLLLERNTSFREGHFKIISTYKTALGKIKVQTKYGDCQSESHSLLKGHTPTITSSINPTEYFINQAKEVHGDKYDYKKVNYEGAYNKIVVGCKIHGDFVVCPKEHLKCNCPKCSSENSGFGFSNWESYNPNNNGILYVLRCWNEEEEFLKIGVTSLSVKERYAGKLRMPYKYEILNEFSYPNKRVVWDIEVDLKSSIKNKYTPCIPFKGSLKECFNTSEKESILFKIKEYENTQIENWIKYLNLDKNETIRELK